MANLFSNLSTIEIDAFRAQWQKPSKNTGKCGLFIIVNCSNNSSVHFYLSVITTVMWAVFLFNVKVFFFCVADNRFEHGNYLSSNNQFLDGSDDAGFIFVSSELKVTFKPLAINVRAFHHQI